MVGGGKQGAGCEFRVLELCDSKLAVRINPLTTLCDQQLTKPFQRNPTGVRVIDGPSVTQQGWAHDVISCDC